MRVRPHEHVVADDDRMPRPSAHEGVLHDDALLADHDRAVLRGEDRAVQDAAAGADPHVAGEHGGGRDRGGGMDDRAVAAMLDQHGRGPQRADAAAGAASDAIDVVTGRFSRSTTTVIAAAVSAASTMCTPTASGGSPLRAW